MKRKKERDYLICDEIKTLINNGYLVKEAIVIVAEKYLLSKRTVLNIWYGQ